MRGIDTVSISFRKLESNEDEALKGYVDSDYAANLDNRKSQTGFVFTLFGATISWKSMLQSVVALSTTKVVYMALIEAVKEVVWLKGILSEFGVNQDYANILCDSKSAVFGKTSGVS